MYQKEITVALFIIAALAIVISTYIEFKRIENLMIGKNKNKRKDY